jgi:hypothetical protein
MHCSGHYIIGFESWDVIIERLTDRKQCQITLTLRQVFICQRPPPILGFCLGSVGFLLVLNLVRNRVLNSCRRWSPTQLNNPPPLPATYCQCILCTLTLGRGGCISREKVRVAIVHKAGSKIPTRLPVSPVYCIIAIYAPTIYT